MYSSKVGDFGNSDTNFRAPKSPPSKVVCCENKTSTETFSFISGNFDAIKLCDFGVTLPLKADGHLDTALAGDRAEYVGTRVWNAPEVCPERISQLVITDKADIFSYGLTLWEMMAKTMPHTPNILDETDSSFDEDAFEEMITALVGTWVTDIMKGS